jgi:hypothetical protein
VLLESHLANGLRPSFAQARWKECASLSRSERLAPRTSGVDEVTLEKRKWLESVILVCFHCLAFCNVSYHRKYHCGEADFTFWIPGARWHHCFSA